MLPCRRLRLSGDAGKVAAFDQHGYPVDGFGYQAMRECSSLRAQTNTMTFCDTLRLSAFGFRVIHVCIRTLLPEKAGRVTRLFFATLDLLSRSSRRAGMFGRNAIIFRPRSMTRVCSGTGSHINRKKFRRKELGNL